MEAASPHLARLGASSRPAGGVGAAEARTYCAAVLERAGFAVREQVFNYSQFPGRWGTPFAGVAAPIAATVWLLEFAAHRYWAIALVAFPVIAGWFLMRGGVPLLRRTGTNLEATRGSEAPIVWLVAHVDSKWQPVSMLVRVAGVICLIAGFLGVIVASMNFAPAAPALLVLTWLGGIPLMLSVVGTRNHGTLDNASGVAAVLDAAAQIPSSARVAVLLTDAEELGLAGARAWARGRAPAVALNCDSVDDEGPLVVMYSRSAPRRILACVEKAAGDEHERLRVMRLIPGILTDSVALADAGWETLTLSRGTVRTLQRIHTSRDTLAAMRGSGIAGAARVLARAAADLAANALVDGGSI